MALTVLQHRLRSIGCYLCQHFKLIRGGGKSSCCQKVSDNDNYVCACDLDNTLCSGLVNCPKLNFVKKSELIKQWELDLSKNKIIDCNKYKV